MAKEKNDSIKEKVVEVKEKNQKAPQKLTYEQLEQLASQYYNQCKSLNSALEDCERKLNEAKSLMPDHPEQAAQVFMQLGSCHRLWTMQKKILKEKYDITWYTPAELHPEIKFD